MKALNNIRPVRRCNHVGARGDVCHRPALHGNSVCYIHFEDLSFQLGYFKMDLDLPVLDNLASIRAAEKRVLAALSAGDITSCHGALCLYALQIARQSTKPLQKVEKKRKAEKRADICPPNLA